MNSVIILQINHKCTVCLANSQYIYIYRKTTQHRFESLLQVFFAFDPFWLVGLVRVSLVS